MLQDIIQVLVGADCVDVTAGVHNIEWECFVVWLISYCPKRIFVQLVGELIDYSVLFLLRAITVPHVSASRPSRLYNSVPCNSSSSLSILFVVH